MEKKKKVLFVATVVRMHINVFHLPYLKWFQEQGWETWVASGNDFENPEECVIPYCDCFKEIPFERNPLKPSNIKAYKQLKKLIDKEKFDIVYCHTPVGAMLARLASIDARKHGTKVIYMAHGFHFYKGAPLKNWLIYYPVEKFLSRYTDMLITINQEDYMLAKRFKAGRVERVPGIGIDLNKFNPAPEKKCILRKKLDIPDDAIVLMSVGELSIRKNQMVIVEALAKLKNDKLHYLICGCGALEGEIKSKAKELDVEEQVHLLGFRNDVFELYNVADIFVFPSLQEGLPVSVMEAMACGLPIVASNVRGNNDLIDEGKGGYLVMSRDMEGFAEAIQKILGDEKKLSEMKRYNLKKIKSYSIERVINQLSMLCGSIM